MPLNYNFNLNLLVDLYLIKEDYHYMDIVVGGSYHTENWGEVRTTRRQIKSNLFYSNSIFL